MTRIDVPATADPRQFAWSLGGDIGLAIRGVTKTVSRSASLSFREFEAIRMRMAQINQCEVCQSFRASVDTNPSLTGDVPPANYFDHVMAWRTSASLSSCERLAAEFAERFAIDHLSLDDDEDFWARLHTDFSDRELVELAMLTSSFIGSGRFQHVFGIDTGCEI